MSDHVQALLDGMKARDAAAIRPLLAGNVVLYSPIIPEAIEGREEVVGVLGLLLSVIDRFEPHHVMHGDGHSATAFSFTAGDVRIDGMDYVRLDEAGLIDFMSVTWRPLPEIVRMQNRIAPLLGIPRLALTER